mmetsp:Transcript_148386/g.413426  ORF Transcript_148386/g.413426 Transcript_148386/m.413426 type:complete len:229 (-) Transcript_148386:494-1180(-)
MVPSGGTGPMEALAAKARSAPSRCASRSRSILAAKCRRSSAAESLPASSPANLPSFVSRSPLAGAAGTASCTGPLPGWTRYRSGTPRFVTADRRKPSASAERPPSRSRSVRSFPREASRDCSPVRSVSNAHRTGTDDPAELAPPPVGMGSAPPTTWHSMPPGTKSASPGRSSGARRAPGRGAVTGMPTSGRRNASLCSPQSCNSNTSESTARGGPRHSGGSRISVAVT